MTGDIVDFEEIGKSEARTDAQFDLRIDSMRGFEGQKREASAINHAPFETVARERLGDARRIEWAIETDVFVIEKCRYDGGSVDRIGQERRKRRSHVDVLFDAVDDDVNTPRGTASRGMERLEKRRR